MKSFLLLKVGLEMVLEMTMSGGEERSGDDDDDEAEVGIDNDDEVETALAGAMAVDHNYSLISRGP